MIHFLHRRALLALLALSLLATACGGDSSSEPATAASQTTTTTSTAEPETTTTTALPTTTVQETTITAASEEFEPTLISYRYPSAGEVEYAISIEQQAEVTIAGGPPEEMPPGAIEMTTTLGGTITYQTSPGPEENTTTIRILSDFDLVENKMSMDGVNLPTPEGAEAPGFETPIDITVVVDEQGNVLEVSSVALEDLFGGESFLPSTSVGNQGLNRPFGPAFPDHPVKVGDSWTEHLEQEGLPGMEMIVTTAEHRLVEVDTVAERTILVMESEYSTEGFEWDMSDFLSGMFGALAEGFGEEDAQEGEETIPQFTMLMSATPSTVIAVTRFDTEAGLVLEGNYQVSGGVTTNMAFPDETGEATAIISTTNYDQTITYQLINPDT